MIRVIGAMIQAARTKMLNTALKSIDCYPLIANDYSERFLADGGGSDVLVMLSKLPITSMM